MPSVDVSSLVPAKAELPEAPRSLTACYKSKLPDKKASADELATANMARLEKLEQCNRAWPKWYGKIREANGATVANVK